MLLAFALPACSGGDGDGSADGSGTTAPTSAETDTRGPDAGSTTTTIEPVELDDAFPAISGFEYALLPEEAIEFFAAGLSAEPGDPLVEGVDARVVRRSGQAVGVLVGYAFGEQFDDAARKAFVAGVGARAGTAPQPVELAGRSMFRVVDPSAGANGILWWQQDRLAFLALAEMQTDAETIAAARVAVD